jgi:hypothetical protein
LGIGIDTPSQLLHVRKIQNDYTWARIDNQANNSAAYSGLQLAAFGNTWGIAIGSSAANSNSLTFLIDAGGGNTPIMTLKTSGNVGIGTNIPASQATGATTGILDVSASAGGNLVLHRTGSSDTALFSILKASNGTYIDSTGAATAANNAIIFRVNNNNADQTTVNEAMRITSDNYARLSSSSGGIQFNGDTAAANALDDYEEGTWTPSPSFSILSTSNNISNGGTYTKIGRNVFIIGRLSFDKNLSTGNFSITGLPFTTLNSVNSRASISIGLIQRAGAASKVVSGVIFENSTTITFYLINQATVTINNLTAAEMSADTVSFIFSATYQV